MKMKRRPAIDGKIVIVTGASSGIGESTAREFARAGATTVLAARRIVDEIQKLGRRRRVSLSRRRCHLDADL